MKRVNEKVRRVITAWETLAPAKVFAGISLEQFKATTKPSFDLRDQIDVLETQAIESSANLDDADTVSKDAALLVVNGVKGDAEHGEDSALYAAMGYIRKSDRQSGLKRIAPDDTTPPDESAPAK